VEVGIEIGKKHCPSVVACEGDLVLRTPLMETYWPERNLAKVENQRKYGDFGKVGLGTKAKHSGSNAPWRGKTTRKIKTFEENMAGLWT
jgi:hypothetical protein